MDDNNIILNQIKINLERLVDKEWPKIEKVIEGHEDRLRKLELYQVKIDSLIPRIDEVVLEIKKGNESYAHIDDIKKIESQLVIVKAELDHLKSYMWKTIGAITVLAFLIPIALKFV